MICKICNNNIKSFQYHLKKVHNIKKSEYNTKFNIKWYSPYSIEYWRQKGYSDNDAKYEISIRRIYNKNYWINKYGNGEGIIKYNFFIKKGFNKEYLIEKYGKQNGNKIYNDRINKRKNNNNTKIGYWLKKGYNEAESLKKLKDRQNTRGKDKLIEKYGKKEGLKKLNEMNERWQTSLSENNNMVEINKKKDGASIEFFIKTHGDNWIQKYLERPHSNKKHKYAHIINYICNNFKFQDELVNKLHIVLKEWKYVRYILHNKLIMFLFGINDENYENLLYKIMNTYGIKNYKKKLYGNIIEYRGRKYKSYGEFVIGKYLEDNDINFINNKKYPIGGCRFLFDFYIENINLFIEYTGMEGIKSYDAKIIKKKDILIKNNLNILFSNDINFIIKRIQTCYGH